MQAIAALGREERTLRNGAFAGGAEDIGETGSRGAGE
jgi:hypothetical protein